MFLFSWANASASNETLYFEASFRIYIRIWLAFLISQFARQLLASIYNTNIHNYTLLTYIRFSTFFSISFCLYCKYKQFYLTFACELFLLRAFYFDFPPPPAHLSSCQLIWILEFDLIEQYTVFRELGSCVAAISSISSSNRFLNLTSSCSVMAFSWVSVSLCVCVSVNKHTRNRPKKIE